MSTVIANTGQCKALNCVANLQYLDYQERVLVLMLDAQGYCEFVSPTWGQFTGEDMSQALGSGWLAYVHPQDSEVLATGLQQSLRDRQSVQYQFRYGRKDGSYRWLVQQSVPRNSPDGQYMGQIAMCFDVTAPSPEQPDFPQSAQNIIDLLRQTPLIGVLLDQHGRVQFFNDAVCKLLQTSATELSDSPFFERFQPSKELGSMAPVASNSTLGFQFPATFESALSIRDLSSRHIRWHAIALRDFSGELSYTALIGDDITALRHIEKQLALAAQIFGSTD